MRDGADSATLLAAVRDDVGLGASLDALDRGRQRPEGSSHGDDLTALEELAALAPDPAALPAGSPIGSPAPRGCAPRLARTLLVAATR